MKPRLLSVGFLMSQRKISVDGNNLLTEEEFEDIMWRLESCAEVEGMFDIIYQCPLCFEFENENGIVKHKNPLILKGN